MRGVLLAMWMLAPVLAGAYHYGPGQEQLQLDRSGELLRQAREEVAASQPAAAVRAFTQALEQLPAGRDEQMYRIRSERAKALLQSQQLPAAYDDLTLLEADLSKSPTADPALLTDVRNSLASAKYYLTWLMRLEGKTRDEWEPEIEGARQTYRLLAEQATAGGDTAAAARHQTDLEVAIRLARLDLSALQALPIPSQCQCCGSGQCQCKGKGKKPGKGAGKGQNQTEGDKFARGAGSGPPPDDGGN